MSNTQQKTAHAPDRILWPEWMIREESKAGYFIEATCEAIAAVIIFAAIYFLFCFVSVVGGAI